MQNDPEDAKILGSVYESRVRGFYTANDFSDLYMSSNYKGDAMIPTLQFLPCREVVFCATQSEIETFLAQNTFFLFNVDNFINLDEVKPPEKSLEQVVNELLILNIKLDKVYSLDLTLEETRVELQDDILNPQGLIEPTEIKYLNFNKYFYEYQSKYNPGFTIQLRLDNTIQIQKRVVYNLLMMFGDVGGFHDIIRWLLPTIFTFFADKFIKADLIQNLFRVSEQQSSNGRTQDQQSYTELLSDIKRTHLSSCNVLVRACSFGICMRYKN